MQTNEVPPTEPTVAEPTRRSKTGPTQPGTFIDPSAMLPRIEPKPTECAHWYWLGLLPELVGIYQLSVAGIAFAKQLETVTRDKDGHTVRTPAPGGLEKLTRSQIARLADHLKMRVVRVRGQRDEIEKGMEHPKTVPTGPNLVATIIRIPSEQESQTRRSDGAMSVDYLPMHGDRALAEFIYCVHVDEESPAPRGMHTKLPPSVAVAGLQMAPQGSRSALPNERWGVEGLIN